ncbi:hypothetical protein [Sphingomonas sp. LY160]|uniref:hypothetical protein n=1 Tax=Sphingomonas sp. LY160 TaxID=3095342 RepID=UPI002ADEE9A9|nr:hypothetical protein [Sphingomonas sp. LY160]MEA1071757.1 hypothetical protein [Sphingomonas sp. LY160]
MASISAIELLRRRLANNHADPEARMLGDLQELPEEFRRSPSVQFEVMSRVATEERLHKRVEGAAARIEAIGDEVIRKLAADASSWAEQRHLSLLTSTIAKTLRTMPVNVEARRRAYTEIGVGSFVILTVAWLALIGGQRLGLLPYPQLTSEENRQLRWAKEKHASGQQAAIEWAAKDIDSDEKLMEAQAAVAASDKGQSVRSEIRDLKACRYRGMVLTQSTNQGPICWFHYRADF